MLYLIYRLEFRKSIQNLKKSENSSFYAQFTVTKKINLLFN